MSIKDFFLKYRFNFIDVLWIMITAQLLINRMFLLGIASGAIGYGFVILTEIKLKNNPEEKKQLLKDMEWKRLADEGHIIDAVKRHRSLYGTSLKDAREIVFEHIGRPI